MHSGKTFQRKGATCLRTRWSVHSISACSIKYLPSRAVRANKQAGRIVFSPVFRGVHHEPFSPPLHTHIIIRTHARTHARTHTHTHTHEHTHTAFTHACSRPHLDVRYQHWTAEVSEGLKDKTRALNSDSLILQWLLL